MIEKVQLPDNYYLQVIPDTWDNNIKVHLIDPISDMQTVLAVFENGRWKSEYIRNLDRFFEILKMYPKVRAAIKRSFTYLRNAELGPYMDVVTFTKTLARQVNVNLYKLIH